MFALFHHTLYHMQSWMVVGILWGLALSVEAPRADWPPSAARS
jgi:hypothetical protein